MHVRTHLQPFGAYVPTLVPILIPALAPHLHHHFLSPSTPQYSEPFPPCPYLHVCALRFP